MPSLGLGYIAAVLRQSGHDVSILHCLKEEFTYQDFEDYIKAGSYQVICYQMFSYDISSIKKYLEIVKKVAPHIVNVVGGYHPSGDPQGVLKVLTDADFGFISEVEIAFPKFITEILNSEPNWATVPNLIWRDNGQIKVNPIQIVEDLDQIPFPAWDLMDPNTYPESPHGGFVKQFPTAPIIITRGCPMKCTFCAGKSITTDHLRTRSVDNVIEEMKFLGKNYGVYDFLIEDENFTHHKKLLREFCQKIIDQKLNISWSCPSGVRLDTLDLESLKAMEKAGCYSLSVGVEFGSQRIHDITKKRLSLEIIKEKLELFKHVKIQTTGFFLFGIPGETKEEMLQTIRFSKELNLDRAQYNNYMPLPGSELFRTFHHSKAELVDYDHYFVHDVSYVPDGMTRNEMKDMQRRAYLEFYLRPKVVLKLLLQVVSIKQFARLANRFFDALR